MAYEFSELKECGRINRKVLKQVIAAAQPGIKLTSLDDLSERLIGERGAFPAFKKVKNYHYSICANVNNGLIHGIPNDYMLKEGDILTVDQGVLYNGWYTDHATSVEVRSSKLKVKSWEDEVFLYAGRKALLEAIKMATDGKRVGDISHAIQETIEKAGFSVVEDYVGHGTGKKLHVSPQIPCFGRPNTGLALKECQILAIEVMYTDSPSRLVVAEDGWTVVARNAKLAALFEKTVMVGKREALILT